MTRTQRPLALAAGALAAVAGLLLPGHLGAEPAPGGPIDVARLARVTQVLASAEFEGRAPGTRGEERTVGYLVEQFRAAGLEPGAPDGSYVQEVPLVRTQVPPDAAIHVVVDSVRRPLLQLRDLATLALRPVDRVTIDDAPLVYVGYGVHAPERGWDDYKGIDLRGKVAVYLVNDPDFESGPADDAHGRFGGRAATYYSRWTYKYEEAARRGAIAALIVHETEPASYGWRTAIAPNGEGYDIVRPDPAREKLLLQSWLHRDTAVELFRAAGLEFESAKRAARSSSFQPVELRGLRFGADSPWRTSGSPAATCSAS